MLCTLSAGSVGSVILDRAAYRARWSELHGQVPARGLVGGWLSLTYAAARPLAARGITPNLITALAVVLAWGAVLAAWQGGPFAAAALVAVSALADGIDGAVAVAAGRETRWGFVVDSVADRVSDAAFLLTLWVVGAPAGLCVAAGGALVALEYTRARAGNAGMHEIGIVTVGERPTRVIVTAMFLLGAGVLRSSSGLIAALGAGGVLGVSLFGWLQLMWCVRRSLASPDS